MGKRRPNKTRQFKCRQCNLAFFEKQILQNHLKCHNPEFSNDLTCHVCHRGFTLKNDRDRHVHQVHFKERNFSCKHCLKKLVTRSALNAHIRLQHSHENLNHHLTRYDCDQCDNVSFGIVERRTHLSIVHKVYNYECRICKKSLTSKQGLQKHERVHTDERPFDCNFCQKSFRFAENLKSHQIVHLDVKPFKCKTCGKSFLREEALRNHIQNLHEKEKKRFRCVFCPASYVVNSELENHIRSHTQEKPYQCKQCSNYYQSAQGLLCHTRQHHSKERKFKCHICEKPFANKAYLNRHKLVHTTSKTEKKHICQYCNKAFVRRCSWRNHQNIHLVKFNKLQKWNCILCAKIFSNNTNLNMHITWHIRETPHMCKICRKEFSSRAQVESHMASHTGERAYKCKICEISYPYPKSLQRHVISYHEGVRIIPFECVFCDSKFGTRVHFWSHLRWHVQEKPYFCPTCNIELSGMPSVKYHIESRNCNSNEKPAVRK